MMNDFTKLTMSLWAKKNKGESRLQWLPLYVHLTDTMNVSRWLWANWLSASPKRFCIDYVSSSNEETALNLAAFLGAIHDIGKATPVFQIQKGFNNSSELEKSLLEKLEQAGFLGIASLTLANPQKTHHSIAGEYLLNKDFFVHSLIILEDNAFPLKFDEMLIDITTSDSFLSNLT